MSSIVLKTLKFPTYRPIPPKIKSAPIKVEQIFSQAKPDLNQPFAPSSLTNHSVTQAPTLKSPFQKFTRDFNTKTAPYSQFPGFEKDIPLQCNKLRSTEHDQKISAYLPLIQNSPFQCMEVTEENGRIQFVELKYDGKHAKVLEGKFNELGLKNHILHEKGIYSLWFNSSELENIQKLFASIADNALFNESALKKFSNDFCTSTKTHNYRQVAYDILKGL
ncbi:MAG: hypothetical protein JHC93_06105 [Parachlamydiales bacterium]|nr:hypothetical protein [Parachlamydiales bacterium]